MAGSYTTQYTGQLESDQENCGTGDVIIAWGTYAFSTTDTSANLAVPVEQCDACLLTIRDGSPVANDLLSHDGTVDGDGLTVFRPAGSTSGLTFDYLICGPAAYA